MHSIFLEASDTLYGLVQYCKEIVVSTSDMGTEFGLNRIQDTPVQDVFPWIRLPVDVEASCDDCGDENPAGGNGGPPREVCISLSQSLAAPGMLHIIHNAAADMLSVAPVLDGVIDKLSSVAALLADPYSSSRLVYTCFTSRGLIGEVVSKQIKTFQGRVYRNGGEVSHIVPESFWN